MTIKLPVQKYATLTFKLMREMANNYSLAIQRNPNLVDEMKKEILAGL